jgi:hypothetical protein
MVGACSADFDSARWRNADASTRERADMIDDLLRTHRLNGLTRAEVTVLLGPPTVTDAWPDWQMVYILGPQRGPVAIDHDWLLLRLNSAGIVTEHRIMND